MELLHIGVERVVLKTTRKAVRMKRRGKKGTEIRVYKNCPTFCILTNSQFGDSNFLRMVSDSLLKVRELLIHPVSVLLLSLKGFMKD